MALIVTSAVPVFVIVISPVTSKLLSRQVPVSSTSYEKVAVSPAATTFSSSPMTDFSNLPGAGAVEGGRRVLTYGHADLVDGHGYRVPAELHVVVADYRRCVRWSFLLTAVGGNSHSIRVLVVGTNVGLVAEVVRVVDVHTIVNRLVENAVCKAPRPSTRLRHCGRGRCHVLPAALLATVAE